MDTMLDEGQPEPGAEALSAEAYVSLDRRVIRLWRVSDLIGFTVLGLPLLVGLLLGGHFLLGNLWAGLGLWLGGVALAVFWMIWYPPRAYRAWGYRIGERVLETKSGVWFRVTKLLPLSRLQHVDLGRGPLERAHGLASLTLHTAGTHEASLVIPGLDAEEAVRLRDRLVAVGGDDAV
jgi:hypothetical protein